MHRADRRIVVALLAAVAAASLMGCFTILKHPEPAGTLGEYRVERCSDCHPPYPPGPRPPYPPDPRPPRRGHEEEREAPPRREIIERGGVIKRSTARDAVEPPAAGGADTLQSSDKTKNPNRKREEP